ncbi:MAG: aminotransferase class IV family protein [Rhizobium sp.]|nr:aminotransferase class IV family protein [Rhizobium sp.]MBX9455675.1 aminotransferase class IV family protein [Rhizobium sp.]
MTDFSLIETMRFEPATGIVRRNLHAARLRNSARVLGFDGAEQALTALDETTANATTEARLRLELFADGRHEIVAAPFVPTPEGTVWRIGVARAARLNSTDPILRHKTSKRAIYDAARAEHPRETVDEVILLNEKDEVCEGTITSIFVDDGSGALLTPPLSSGCLAGILRTSLICGKKARNRRLTLDDLARHPFYVGNSLRGLVPATLA